jgi:hypothetical protein
MVLVVAYQLTPASRNPPYKFLEDIPVIWFILFSIARGLLLATTYPLWILLIAAAYIYKWIDERFYKLKKSRQGKYDELIKTVLNCDGIMVDGSEKYDTRVDHPHTISSDDGLLKYTLYFY